MKEVKGQTNVGETIARFFDETVPEILESKPQLREELKNKVQFQLTGEAGGEWYIDTEAGRAIKGGNDQATSTIVAQADQFALLLIGPVRGWISAYLKGEVQIKGNIVHALRIRKLFDQFI
jgi:putative sterol carrier protein